jgi:hypothetical protein
MLQCDPFVILPRERPTEEGKTSSPFKQWISQHGEGVVMVVIGFAFVVAAVWVVADRQALATALVVFGAGMITLGALLPRIEGAVTLSVQEGLKFTLAAQRAAERKAAEQQLSPEKTEQVVTIAVERAATVVPMKRQLLRHRVDAIISAPTADAIADEAIARVIDLDAAKEQRRREGHDVDNEPLFEDVMNKVNAGQELTDKEQASWDALIEQVARRIRGDKGQS